MILVYIKLTKKTNKKTNKHGTLILFSNSTEMLFILSFSLNSINSRTKYSSFYWLCFLLLPFSRLYLCCPPSQDPFLTFCYDLSVPQRYVWKDWNVPWIFLCEEFWPWYGHQRWHMTLKNEVQCSLKVLLQKILRSFFCEPLVILRCCLV